MIWNEYLILSEKTLSTQFHCDTQDELLLHAVVGILTEIEELLDNHIDKSDEVNRAEEVADVWWYLAILGRKYTLNMSPTVLEIDNPLSIVISITKISLKMLDFLKKKLYYNKPINEELFTKYTNEVISLLFSYAKFYNIDTNKSWDINISKLKSRYGEKFSSERAINRDLHTERKILEGNDTK